MPPPFWIKPLGAKGEYWARRYLHRRGYHLVAQNWRYGKGELDLVMANHSRVLFCEIKTRRKRHGRRLRDLLHPRQEKRLVKLAHQFLRQYPETNIPWQFLLIEVVPNARGGAMIQTARLSSGEAYLNF